MTIVVVLMMVSLIGCQAADNNSSTLPEPAATMVIEDMSGRTVEVPMEINKVISSGPTGTVFLYTLAPDKLGGWNSPLREAEKRYIQSQYHNLPIVGTWRGSTSSGNVEEVVKIKPDLVISRRNQWFGDRALWFD